MTWLYMGENEKAEHDTEEDIVKVINALSHDDFQGNFTISITNDSAEVRWSMNEENRNI